MSELAFSHADFSNALEILIVIETEIYSFFNTCVDYKVLISMFNDN